MRPAREPMPAARVLDHKLANWSGGRRYTCPSYEIVRVSDGVRIAVPGLPALRRLRRGDGQPRARARPRAAPETVEEILLWTGTPLATQEVAVVCDVPLPRRASAWPGWQERHVGLRRPLDAARLRQRAAPRTYEAVAKHA